jgi:tetratricopeptide (TPR) repeat protein
MSSLDRTQTSDDASPKVTARSQALTPGTLLGRYVVRDRLGEGAMGEVYLAYDFALDRRVALKLLHPRPTDTSQRLLQEAKAMARLSHPNVVTVHDVGMVGERAFLAMEYVEGATLRVWLEAQPRTWRQVRDLFLGAGTGLAAAHAAGLVHRDFKPENVLVDGHGHARVTDFGVARTSNETSGSAGTPGYIAPEQRRGEVSASADQYSFCVTLNEALAKTSGVPSRVRSAVQRGLSEDPSARFPTMNALLAELSPGAVSSRSQAVLAVGGLLAALGLGQLYFAQRDRQLCASGPSELDAVWDADTRQQLERAFETSPKPYVKAMFGETAARLDRWAQGFTAAHREACEATRIHGTQSQQLLDLRMACLSARKAEAKALTALLITGEAPSRLDRAADAVSGLPSLASCSSEDMLRARAAPPATNEDQAKVETLRTAIAHARARHDTGDVKQAEKELRAAVAEAKAIQYAPVQAEAQIQLTRALLNLKAFKEAEETAFSAFVAAQGASHDSVAVEAALLAGYATAIAQLPAERWRALAASAVSRDGNKLRHLASLEKMRAYTLVREGLPEQALVAAQAALRLRERELGKDAPELASEMFDLIQTLEVLGRLDEALVYADRQAAIRVRTHGEEHPATAVAQQLRATCLRKLGRLDEAVKVQLPAIAVLERAYGKGHPATANPLGNLVEMFSTLGRHDEAVALSRRAIQIIEESPVADPTQLAVLRVHLGSALLAARRPTEALPLLEVARGVLEKHQPGGFVPLSSTLELLTETLLALGRPGDALVEGEKCLALTEKARSDPVNRANVHLLMAKALDSLTLADRPSADLHLAQAQTALTGTGEAGQRRSDQLAEYLRVRVGVVRASR